MTDARTLTDTAIVELEPQQTAAVRIKQPMAELDLASAFDRLMPLVASEIGARGGVIGGPPYGTYHQFGPDIVLAARQGMRRRAIRNAVAPARSSR